MAQHAAGSSDLGADAGQLRHGVNSLRVRVMFVLYSLVLVVGIVAFVVVGFSSHEAVREGERSGALLLRSLPGDAGWSVVRRAAEQQHGRRRSTASRRSRGGATSLFSHFGGAVMENWQSEFLQFSLFIAATIWLVQKGSNESKSLEAVRAGGRRATDGPRHTPAGGPSWARANDWRTRIYENSLLLVMTFIFLATWLAQSLNNWRVFNQEQEAHDGPRVSWARYLLDPDFWEKTLQNWQSEFLAIGTIVVFTIFLRQRGSPESKPVGAPHDETATSG